MSEIHDEIIKLEGEIANAEMVVDQRKKAMALENHPLFRELFVDGYFLHGAARLVQMSTDTRVADEIRQSSLEEAKATGYMSRYLTDIIMAGAYYERTLPDMHATLDELRAAADQE